MKADKEAVKKSLMRKVDQVLWSSLSCVFFLLNSQHFLVSCSILVSLVFFLVKHYFSLTSFYRMLCCFYFSSFYLFICWYECHFTSFFRLSSWRKTTIPWKRVQVLIITSSCSCLIDDCNIFSCPLYDAFLIHQGDECLIP